MAESEFFQPENDTVLDNNEAKGCEGPSTEKEYLEALKNMDHGTTPGSDGLSGEFYKHFWKEVSSLLVNALNFAYHSGTLSITQRRGIIKLVPKKESMAPIISPKLRL